MLVPVASALLTLIPTLSLAHAVPHDKRQTLSTPPASGLIQTTPALLSDGFTVPPLTQITMGAPTTATGTLAATPTAGQSGPFASAPVLPTFSFATGVYPSLDTVPPTDSAQMKQWLSEIDLSSIPNLSITNGSCAANPTEASDTSRCWWTCGGCTRSTDLTTCPDKLTWGLSYDDGPSPYTPYILDYLTTAQLKATFFVVGSRVISRPDILREEHVQGHQISVHTWSHTALTTQTNEQIVAELKWTMKAIKDVTGVTPNTMRPPYGDIDDRVRAICKLLGLTPILWTQSGGVEFDTNDWKIPGGTATGQSSVAAFDTILETASSMDTGFITLEHDLYAQSVDLAVGYFLPSAQSSTNPKFTLKSIIDCQHKPLSEAYLETATNATLSSSSSSSSRAASSSVSSSGSVAVTVPVTAASGSASTGASASASASRTSLAFRSTKAAGVPGLMIASLIVLLAM